MILKYSIKPQESWRALEISLLPRNEINLQSLNSALDELAKLKPLEKPRLLKACAICITADQHITSNEVELYRAIAAILDCPVPPLDAAMNGH